MQYGARRIDSFVGSDNFFDYTELSIPEVSSSAESHLESSATVDSEAKMKPADYMVAFSTKTENYCVGLVDMVDSTKISSRIGPARISRYYQIFLNSMSRILGRFGGYVIKNVGDCLVYYFPESSKEKSRYGFMSCLECSLAMVEARNAICQQLIKEGLPSIDYRVSADYGAVVIMKSTTSDSLDMIGPPVNMCSKINHSVGKNEIALGGDLVQMVKDLEEYKFEEIKGYSMGFKYAYPIYSLKRK